MSKLTYTNPENNKSFTFTTEQIRALKEAYTKARKIADSVDSEVSLDANWMGAVTAIYFHLAPEIAGCPDFYTYTANGDDEEPFLEWTNNVELN